MLPKKRKLHAADFKKMRGAHSFSSNHFLLQRRENGAAAPSCFAVVTAVSVSKSAVVRNKIRRQIFAFLHSLLPKCRDGYLVVVRVKKEAKQLSLDEKQDEILGLLKRAGILGGNRTPYYFGNGG